MSLSIDEIKRIQKQFDLEHSVNGKGFYCDINETNINELEHLAVCLTGELGEFCNLLKKVVRGDLKLDDTKEEMSEELADCFIYLIKISNQFNVDIEAEFLKKLDKNQARFDKSIK
jgi:NTP pyrophosphatase (non-canonical NTP hydrolase)